MLLDSMYQETFPPENFRRYTFSKDESDAKNIAFIDSMRKHVDRFCTEKYSFQRVPVSHNNGVTSWTHMGEYDFQQREIFQFYESRVLWYHNPDTMVLVHSDSIDDLVNFEKHLLDFQDIRLSDQAKVLLSFFAKELQ